MEPSDESKAPVIIMARPQMAENVGAAARAMANFGMFELRLVGPDFGWPSAKALSSSSGAYDVLHNMTIHGNLRSALHDITLLYATTARARGLDIPVLSPSEAVAALAVSSQQEHKAAILFGPERSGLNNDEICLADGLINIPVNPSFASLNVSQAVLVMAYEWRRQFYQEPLFQPQPSAENKKVATKDEIEGLLRQLNLDLDEVGFFRSEQRKKSLKRSIAILFERRKLLSAEVQLLRGIIKELKRGPLI